MRRRILSPTYTVAIDLSKHKHTATILDTTTTSVCQTVAIPVSQTGFQRFEATLAAFSTNPEDFVIGCEATGHYGETLLRRLQDKGFPIVRMNPAQVVQFRHGLGRRAKTDALDADAMAKQLAIAEWTAEQPIGETTRRLQSLTRLRLDFVEEQSRWINRVRGLVNQIYPELEPILKHITSPTSLAILTHFPSRSLLANASVDEITAVVKQASRGSKREAFACQIQQIAQMSVGLDDPWLETELRLVLNQLTALNENVKHIEKNIKALTEQLLEEYTVNLNLEQPLTLRAFPCGDYLTIGTLLSEIGDISRFKSLKHLLSYFGWCPNTQESGMSSVAHPRVSRRGNRFARRIIWMMAIAAVRWVPEYRTYFNKRVATGKHKMKTLIAVGRKLLSVVYAILRTGQPYDAQRYLRQPILTATP